MEPPKFKLFYHSCQTQEIFMIKFDKIWGYHDEGISLKQGCQIQT